MQSVDTSGKSGLDYLRNIDQKGNIIAEYIWIDGALGMRSKCRTLPKKIESLADLPEWNYDGSSTYQATTESSEIIMKPIFYFADPFRGGDNVMVLCETYSWTDGTFKELTPSNTNFRKFAKEIFDSKPDEQPWFGIEQEYIFLQQQNNFQIRPYGWPSAGFPGLQGPYYCSVGGNVTFGRSIADAHYKCCLFAGIKISGTNAEVFPGQWEFQIGPCLGIEQGDQLWAARYLLQRCAEDYNLSVSFKPKIFSDWNGSGCHTNFSTAKMREGSGGMEYIEGLMEKFAAKHALHISLYGADNHKRLTGVHETSSIDKFSFGTGNRAASFRIPTQVMHDKGRGYVEDRRPASNIDPYIVSSIVFDTACLEQTKAEQMVEHYKKWINWLPRSGIPAVQL